jgi:hypothetical protein
MIPEIEEHFQSADELEVETILNWAREFVEVCRNLCD